MSESLVSSRKMRRRIRRQIETGKQQTRVRQLDENTFGYVVKHGQPLVRFKVGKSKTLGRFRLVKVT